MFGGSVGMGILRDALRSGDRGKSHAISYRDVAKQITLHGQFRYTITERRPTAITLFWTCTAPAYCDRSTSRADWNFVDHIKSFRVERSRLKAGAQTPGSTSRVPHVGPAARESVERVER